MSHRLFHVIGAGIGVAALLGLGGECAAQQRVLRHVPQADLKVLDPVVNPAFITVQHSYLVYDQLFSLDSEGRAQPQMVESVEKSADGKTHTFKLRPGLRFHDGTPVRAADAAASVRRWASKDPAGKKMLGWGMTTNVIDERTFAVALDVAFGQILEILGKPSWPLFIMREKDAALDITTSVSEVVGSGPFRFVRAEWVPGSKVVYERNPDYVPRAEKADFLSGGKVVNFDRIEWNIIADPATAAAALGKGEVDVVETLPGDILESVEKNRDVTVRIQKLSGMMGMIRLNHLHPPFNNPKAREALLYMVDQGDYMTVAIGNEKRWRECHAFLVCDTPYGTEVGAEAYKKANLEKAKQLLKEAGYAGEKIVVMHPTNISIVREMSETTIQKLREIGMNVDMQPIEWTAMLQRRFKPDKPSEGGWHMWHTYAPGLDLGNPLTSYAMDAPCQVTGWPGWACDPELEKMREEFALAPDTAARRKVGERIQRQAVKLVPIVPLGQFFSPVSFRSNLVGFLETPIPVMWNVARR
jgi:peptide/nickel transport system substrate-binding protein